MIANQWTTLYDVTRNGIGIVPWLLAVLFFAVMIVGGIALRNRFKERSIFFWLVIWMFLLVAPILGFGGVFYQYGANCHALKAGLCEKIEGPIADFHQQDLWKKGDSERF